MANAWRLSLEKTASRNIGIFASQCAWVCIDSGVQCSWVAYLICASATDGTVCYRPRAPAAARARPQCLRPNGHLHEPEGQPPHGPAADEPATSADELNPTGCIRVYTSSNALAGHTRSDGG